MINTFKTGYTYKVPNTSQIKKIGEIIKEFTSKELYIDFPLMHDYARINDLNPFPLEDVPQEKWTRNVSDEFYLDAFIPLLDYLW